MNVTVVIATPLSGGSNLEIATLVLLARNDGEHQYKTKYEYKYKQSKIS